MKRYKILIYCMGFLDLLGVSMTIPMLSKHARDIGASPTVAGLIGSLYGFLQLFSSPIVGRWSDVSGRKQVLVWCLLLSAVSYALLGVALSLIVLVVARIPAGLFKHSQELSKSLLADMTQHSEHSRVFGQFNSFSNLGFIVGPVIAGYIADYCGGFCSVARLTAAIFLLNVVLVHMYLLPQQQQQQQQQEHQQQDGVLVYFKSIRDHVPYDWRHVTSLFANLLTWAHRCVRDVLSWLLTLRTNSRWLADVYDILLVRFLVGGAVLVYRSDFVLVAAERYNATNTLIGYMSSTGSLFGTLTGFGLGWFSDLYSNDCRRLFLHSVVLQLAALVVLVFAPNTLLLTVSQAVLSVACAVGRVAAVQLTLLRGRREYIGALMGAGATVLSVARMLAPTASGLALQFHVTGPVVVATILTAAGSLLLAVSPSKQVHIE